MLSLNVRENPLFRNNIFQGIDAIGSKQFVDDKIDIDLNMNASFFLFGLPTRDGVSQYDLWERIYNAAERIPGLLCTGVKGLRLKKTSATSSYDNQVNPEFLKALKKVTMAYLSIMASNWKECDKPDWLQCDKDDRVLTNQFEVRNPTPHCILIQIAELHTEIKDKIKIHPINGGIYITGKKENLKKYLDILQIESLDDKRKILFLAGARKNPESSLSKLPPDLRKYIFSFIKPKCVWKLN